VRLLGILALAAGIAGTVQAITSALSARRPLDLAWAALAPATIVLALVGLLTILSPGFLLD
jgi:hypothetical protein